MQKLLGLGSYQTGWTMLHRYRTAMIRPGREVLTGRVEVDETFLGGAQPGVRGRGALARRWWWSRWNSAIRAVTGGPG